MKAILSLVILLVLSACNESSTPLTVMSRNVYVGGDVDRVIAASSPEDLALSVLLTWQEVVANDFRNRAKALAAEVASVRPDILGLQEITTFCTQDPGDAAFGGSTPATNVEWDYLEILLEELEALGLSYSVAGVVQDSDVEMPLLTRQEPLAFMDIRMTDYDAVLVSDRVSVSGVVTRNFSEALEVPMPGGASLRILRGFVMFDAVRDGISLRFASTHLEPASDPALLPLQQAQAAELLSLLGNGPAIVVGDLNSPAPHGGSYRLFLDAGFRDAWSDANPGVSGPTCCWSPSLRESTRTPDERIDLILHRSAGNVSLVATESRRLGLETILEAGDIYPSDHLGVSAQFEMESN